MALQLYLGNSGSGKSHAVYENIIKQARENKNERFIVLVPEQFTMQTQKELVLMHPCKGILNIDVLSFNRLAYKIFAEVGCNKTPVIDEIGKTFIVRKTALQNKDNLEILGSSLGKTGLVNEMKSLISELLQYDISLDKLDEIIENNKDNKGLQKKLKDMRVVYDAFSSYKEEKYITSEEIPDVLCRNIEKSEWIKNTTIVLDGYTGFTPIQRRLVEKLMALSKNIYVTITFDASYSINSAYPDYSLFHMSSRMLWDIEQMAQKTGTKRLDDVILKDNRRLTHEALFALEKNIFRSRKNIYEKEQTAVNLAVCKNPLQEVEYVAGKINRLVQEKGYRFSDIAVVTGDMEAYGVYIKRVFDKYNINCFIDSKVAVLTHPAVSFIRAAMRVVIESFSYNSIISFLRSDFSGFNVEDIDVLDNYLVATGISSKTKWSEAFVYQTRLVDAEGLSYINLLREKIYGKIMPFYEVFSKSSTTIMEKSEALFNFMNSFSLQKKIEQFTELFEEDGRLIYAKEYAQIYRVILNVLDSLVELLGDERIPSKEYEKLLEAGFLEQKVGVIPSGGDEVVFGDIERSRLSEIKALFVLGGNDGIIPKHGENTGILSELDRRVLEEQGVVLSTGTREKYFNQKFYLYLNLTKPSEYLHISYSKINSSGEAINPSYLLEEIFGIFPNIKIEDVDEFMKLPESVTCNRQGFEYVINNINRVNTMTENEREGFEFLYGFYSENGKQKQLRGLENAGKVHLRNDRIDNAVAKVLYGDVLEGSVTRFEQFAKCAYAHFLKYGLKLREREEAGFYQVDFGNIMHSILEKYFKYLKDNGLSFNDAVSMSMDEILDKCIDEAITEYGNTAIYFSFRDKYQIKRLRRIAKRTLWALQKQFVAGKFTPADLEVNFRSINDVGDSVKMALRGRIDRVDVYESEDKVYVKVVDYKTGKKAFNLLEVYYGTSLQLMLYLDEAVRLTANKDSNKGKNVVPAAVLYYKIHDPFVEQAETDEEVSDSILSQLKVDGLISEEAEVLAALDTEFDNETSSYESMVAPIATTKAGVLTKNSKTTAGSDFGLICRYAKRKAAEIGKSVYEGCVEVLPALELDDDICEYCSYHSVCRFEQGKSPVKETPKMKESEIIVAMTDALNDNENVSTDRKTVAEEV